MKTGWITTPLASCLALVIVGVAFLLSTLWDDSKQVNEVKDSTIENAKMIVELEKKVNKAVFDLINMMKRMEEVREQIGVELIPVVVTAYNPVKRQTDDTPNITASNKKVRVGIVALSRDIEKEFNLEFGDEIHLMNLGKFIFEDRMNKRWRRRVDILMLSKKEAKEFGLKSSFLVIDRKGIQ